MNLRRKEAKVYQRNENSNARVKTMRNYVTVMAETNIPSFAHAPRIMSQTVPIQVSTSCRIVSQNL
jgi:hypothetical protein